MKIVKQPHFTMSKSLKYFFLFAIVFLKASTILAQPTASNPVGVNVECIGDVPAPDVLVVTDETDNCTGTPVVAWVNDVSDGNTCPEVITRTYSVSDDCGNSINVTQTITINDNIAPLLAASPAAVTIECIDDVPAMTNLNWTDNCDGSGSVTGTDGPLIGGVCGGTITRTWTYTDACGNTATNTQIITINDVTSPSASNPIALNVECIYDVPFTNNTVVTDEADNCSIYPVVAFVSDVSDGNTCPEVITRTYSVTDDCGNVTTVTQTITVNDVTPPTASNPPVINTTGSAPGPDPLVVTDEADNCTVNPIVTWVSDVSDGLIDPETITRTYCVTDDCGNQTCVSQQIIIGAVGLSETELVANIKVFPNPTNGLFRIQFDEKINEVEVTIRNILGEVIQFSKYDTAKEIELTLNDSSGIYFVGIRSAINQEVFIRVVKE